MEKQHGCPQRRTNYQMSCRPFPHRLACYAGVLVVAGVLLTGCTDGGPSDLVSSEEDVSPLDGTSQTVTGEVCEVINFSSFTHRQAITQVQLATLGLTLNISTVRFAPNGGTVNARAFQSDGDNDDPDGSGSVIVEDDDLQWRGEDSQDADALGGECPGCEPLGTMLVIPDNRSFVPWGDHRFGGTVTFTGFSGGEFFVKEFTAVDNDTDEPTMKLFVDGTLVGESSMQGNGSVEVVTTSQDIIDNQIQFRLGDQPNNSTNGSGALDNIKICGKQEEETGDEGCTLGYWKNHTESWPSGYDPDDLIQAYFNDPRNLVPNDDTLLDGLNYGGGPGLAGGARILLKQAIAALLNAAHPDVDYAITSSSVISQTNAALATGTRSNMTSLAATLDGYNQAGCPLN